MFTYSHTVKCQKMSDAKVLQDILLESLLCGYLPFFSNITRVQNQPSPRDYFFKHKLTDEKLITFLLKI